MPPEPLSPVPPLSEPPDESALEPPSELPELPEESDEGVPPDPPWSESWFTWLASCVTTACWSAISERVTVSLLVEPPEEVEEEVPPGFDPAPEEFDEEF